MPLSPSIAAGITPELRLASLVEMRQELKARALALDAHVETINDDIKTTMSNMGITELVVAGHKITLNLAAERTSLDKQKLLEQGVTMEQIKAATKTTTSVLLNVRPVKETK